MMRTKKLWSLLSAGAVLMGLMSSPVLATEVIVEVTQVLEKTVDNVIVLYDSSSSMKEKYANTNMTSLEAERKVLSEANMTLPNLDWNVGLYSFTPGLMPSLDSFFKTISPMTPYNKDTFAKAINTLPTKPGGATFLQHALEKIDPIIAGLKGKTAILIFTDGTYSKMQNETPLTLAKKLVKKYGTCIYAVSSAKGENEQALIKAMGELNECSMVIPFEKLLGNPGYTTGALYRVIEKAVAIDIVDGLFFDFNKSDLKAQYQAKVLELGQYLEAAPNVRVVLAGYTDGVGSEGYNMELSKKRSESVAELLLAHAKIDPNRISLQWYGKADPIAKNNSETGRALNRRVSVILVAM
ncbi:MAG: OmpA family protein [Desulfobulbaceae bacterium]|nr:OmpA family protein [Desulfobulbaceae bacterium]